MPKVISIQRLFVDRFIVLMGDSCSLTMHLKSLLVTHVCRNTFLKSMNYLC